MVKWTITWNEWVIAENKKAEKERLMNFPVKSKVISRDNDWVEIKAVDTFDAPDRKTAEKIVKNDYEDALEGYSLSKINSKKKLKKVM